MSRSTLILMVVISCTILRSSWAEEQSRSLQAIEYLSGYGQAELSQKEDYCLIPIIIDFDFNLKPLTERVGFNPKSLVQFQLEPFLNLVTNPEDNIEVGASFFFKFGILPETFRFQPYFKFGTGMIYTTQHTLEQSTQFNFISQAGVGFHYTFKRDYAFTLEYRFRHLSNASIKSPNSGIDHDLYLFGITRFF